MIPDIILAYLEHHFPNLEFVLTTDRTRIVIYNNNNVIMGYIEKHKEFSWLWATYDGSGSKITNPYIYSADDNEMGNDYNWDWLKERNGGY